MFKKLSPTFNRERLFQIMIALNFKYLGCSWTLGCEYALFDALRTGVYAGYLLDRKEVRALRKHYILGWFHWHHLPDSKDEIVPIGFREWRTLRMLRPVPETPLLQPSGTFYRDA